MTPGAHEQLHSGLRSEVKDEFNKIHREFTTVIDRARKSEATASITLDDERFILDKHISDEEIEASWMEHGKTLSETANLAILIARFEEKTKEHEAILRRDWELYDEAEKDLAKLYTEILGSQDAAGASSDGNKASPLTGQENRIHMVVSELDEAGQAILQKVKASEKVRIRLASKMESETDDVQDLDKMIKQEHKKLMRHLFDDE